MTVVSDVVGVAVVVVTSDYDQWCCRCYGSMMVVTIDCGQ